EASQLLQTENMKVSKRTVNYYAFSKKMFDITTNGKKCFTTVELDKLRSIFLLKEYTNYTLEQIKVIINSHTIEEIKEICARRVSGIRELNSNLLQDFTPRKTYVFNPYFPPKVSEDSKSEQSDGNRTITINEDISLVVSQKVNSKKIKKMISLLRILEDE
ncbi:MAG: hypothetical protein WA113_10480, partial [Desulfitobacteriaceae bacterium]